MVDPDDLGGDKGFSQTHLVRDERAAAIADQPQRPRNAVRLEAGQRQTLVFLRQLLDFLAVELIQDAQKDLPWRVRREDLLVERGEIDRLGLRPQLVEPFAGPLHHRVVVAPEIEFEIARQAAARQVRGAGDDAGPAAEQPAP